MAVTYSNDNKPKKQATIKEEKVFIFYNKLYNETKQIYGLY